MRALNAHLDTPIEGGKGKEDAIEVEEEKIRVANEGPGLPLTPISYGTYNHPVFSVVTS
jgi:hypothetical protein